jgi:hypothetical protein
MEEEAEAYRGEGRGVAVQIGRRHPYTASRQ